MPLVCPVYIALSKLLKETEAFTPALAKELGRTLFDGSNVVPTGTQGTRDKPKIKYGAVESPE
jgi:hypothetical protein